MRYRYDRERVILAMSGGVDSSVAASILKDKGYSIKGITLIMTHHQKGIEAARAVAKKLGFPHETIDVKKLFQQNVIKPFLTQYLKGKTPNPCIICNFKVKFGFLIEKLPILKADFISTGHYAKIEYDEKRERFILKKGVDPKREQSYFLFALLQEQLKKIKLCLSNFKKEDVLKIAADIGIDLPYRSESREICFIPDNDYRLYIKKRFPDLIKPGKIIDRKGNILGEHQGIAFYTIGQRKGLGPLGPKPKYVIQIDPKNNSLIVGDKSETLQKEFYISKTNWISYDMPPFFKKLKVKIRYNSSPSYATIYPKDDDIYIVKLEKPQSAITPGQAAVFYEGDETVVGGWICDEY